MQSLCGMYGLWASGYVERRVAPKNRMMTMAAILNYGGPGILYSYSEDSLTL